MDRWPCYNLLQVVTALLLLKALAAGGAGNGAVLFQPCLKLFVMRFVLQEASVVSVSTLCPSTWDKIHAVYEGLYLDHKCVRQGRGRHGQPGTGRQAHAFG